MRWSNVALIFRREVRDQVRDRRTLFMIFVLPILLYPLLGIGVLKFAATLEEKPRIVVVVGSENLPKAPRLLNADGDGFNPDLFDSPTEAERLVVQQESGSSPWADPVWREQEIRHGSASAVMVIPTDMKSQLQQEHDVNIPIKYKSVDEPSQITYFRLKELLERWKTSIVAARLKRDQKTESYTEPIRVKAEDVATAREVGGSVWARLFPFLLVMMSLTGAFYPAVDICAGEKERGTMETLLISPASRTEIVLGKFFTVMLASVMTAMLNLVSMGLTGMQMASRIGSASEGVARGGRAMSHVLAPPTLQAGFWMVLLLIPLAAFFSAVCVSLAVLARSMKEGQYYMTPLYMVALPLVFLTLAPGVELDLFYSLVPITGVALLLRALILGSYDVAFRFFLPVMVPTIVYAGVALRWAIDQFQREDVLFREAERFSISSWLRHLYRDRDPTPTSGQATLCFALILCSSWFLMQYLAFRGEPLTLASVAAGQSFILLPPLFMAFLLTADPLRTLRIAWPRPRYLLLGLALPITLNPLINELQPVVERFFPISSMIKEALGTLMGQAPRLTVAIVVFALIPAICEEFAFRGFILSGLERQHRTRSAILLSALMFGFLHVLLSLFQQLFNATLLGIILGLLAVRSRSILPGILFHFLNNGMAVARGYLIQDPKVASLATWIYRNPSDGLYHGGWIAASVLLSGGLLLALWKWKPGPSVLVEDKPKPVEDEL
jgi:sodium transport system permease protein